MVPRTEPENPAAAMSFALQDNPAHHTHTYIYIYRGWGGGSIQKRWPYRQINPRLLAGPSFWSLYSASCCFVGLSWFRAASLQELVFFCLQFSSCLIDPLRTFAWSSRCGAVFIFLKLETLNRCRARGICSQILLTPRSRATLQTQLCFFLLKLLKKTNSTAGPLFLQIQAPATLNTCFYITL